MKHILELEGEAGVLLLYRTVQEQHSSSVEHAVSRCDYISGLRLDGKLNMLLGIQYREYFGGGKCFLFLLGDPIPNAKASCMCAAWFPLVLL